MGSANIQAKIKRGLAKAVNKTGSASSELVYLVNVIIRIGTTPLDDVQKITENVELVNAIFREYDKKLIGGNIVKGDRELVCDNTVEIKTGDTIIQGVMSYTVIDLEIKAPTSDTLLYIAQVRIK
jgi:hypothetical protein